MRPIVRAFHEDVFDGVVMDIVHVPFEILVVANRVFPETALPHRTFAVAQAGEAGVFQAVSVVRE